MAHFRYQYLRRPLESIGDMALGHMEQAGLMGILLFKALLGFVRPPYELSDVVKQLHFIGARSLPVIVVAGAFTGMVLRCSSITRSIVLAPSTFLARQPGLPWCASWVR